MKIKSLILEKLIENKGEFVSGERLAETFGVSRMYVSKVVKTLKESGFSIESVPKKGYILNKEDDSISKEEIRFRLKDSNFLGEIIVFDELPSTNTFSKGITLSDPKKCDLVIADEQKAGRGRFDRQFVSKKGGGIYMSLIINPFALGVDSSVLTIMTAVAVARTLKNLHFSPSIKWVNDIFLSKKKVSGILCEASFELETNMVTKAILGVGLNVNMTKADLQEFKNIATTLYEEKKEKFSRSKIVTDVILELERLIKNYDKKKIIDEYKSMLNTLNKNVVVSGAGIEKCGKVIDLDENGALILKTKSGEILCINSGEISVKEDEKI